MKLTKEQLLGIIRHVLTFAGAIVITKGLVDQGTVDTIIGSAVSLTGAIWSIVSKKA
mgnify:FL=1